MMANVQDPEVAEIHRQLEYLPMLTGTAPPSWRKAIDVMIEKKAGVYQVDKLRAICLFDSIANHSFKYVGKEMMKLAESNGLLATAANLGHCVDSASEHAPVRGVNNVI